MISTSQEYLVGATRDADTIGQIDGHDASWSLPQNELGMDDSHDYFQAGVILMNLEEIRSKFSGRVSKGSQPCMHGAGLIKMFLTGL